MIEPSLQLGGGNWANKSDKLLGYHKNGANFYADELTFSRNSLGSYTDANGLVQSMPYNLLQQSNTFDTTWLSNGTTETSGQSGYDGSNNAWLLQRNDGLARFVYQTISITNTSTFSVYAKAGNVNWIYFNNGSGASVYFDLLNGAVGSITGGNTASIQSVGNGWYRCSAILTNGSENRIYPAISNNVVSGLVGANIYIQDAQLNQGSTALPYFATTTRLNLARVDYLNNPNGSLLLEPQRTNLALYSSEFDNAAWSKEAVSVTANAATSPDGTTNADKILETAVNDVHLIYNTSPITASATSTASVFYKKGTRRYFSVKIQIGSNSYTQVFDSEGLTTGGNSSNGLTNVSTKIEDYGNGWVRASVAGTSASGTSTYVIVGLSNSLNPTFNPSNYNPTYQGSVTDYGYVYGAQVEASSYPTSYIKSEGAATTRLGDACLTTNLQSASIIGATQGTFFLNTTKTTASTWVNQRIFETGTTTRSLLLDNLGGQIRLRVWDASSVGPTITTSGLVEGFVKYLIKWDGTNVKVFANGVLQGSSAAPSYAYNTYSAYENTAYSNNAINQLLFFPTALSDAELLALTTL